MGLRPLGGSGPDARRPASRRASLHVGAIFGALWRPLGGVRRAMPYPDPRPGAPSTPACSPRGPPKPPSHSRWAIGTNEQKAN